MAGALVGLADPTSNAVLGAGVDHAVILRGRVNLPAKHAAVKRRQAPGILADDFDVHNWVSYVVISFLITLWFKNYVRRTRFAATRVWRT